MTLIFLTTGFKLSFTIWHGRWLLSMAFLRKTGNYSQAKLNTGKMKLFPMEAKRGVFLFSLVINNKETLVAFSKAPTTDTYSSQKIVPVFDLSLAAPAASTDIVFMSGATNMLPYKVPGSE